MRTVRYDDENYACDAIDRSGELTPPTKRYGPRFTWYGDSGAARHMSTTQKGMSEYKLCKGMSDRTASDQMLPVLRLSKLHLGVKQESRTGLILDAILHVPMWEKNLFSIRAIDKAGLDIVGKNGVLTNRQRRIRLVPKSNLQAYEGFHVPTNFPTKFVHDL